MAMKQKYDANLCGKKASVFPLESKKVSKKTAENLFIFHAFYLLFMVFRQFFDSDSKIGPKEIKQKMGGGYRNVHVDIGRWSIRCPQLST